MSDRFIDGPPAGLEGWRKVWQENLRYPLSRSARFLGSLVGWLERVRHRQRADDDRQRDFNLASLDLVSDLGRDLSALRHDVQSNASQFRDDLEQVRSDLIGEIRQLRQLLPIVANRNDALMSAIDRKIETLGARLRDLSIPALSSSSAAAFRDDFIYRRLEDQLRGSPEEIGLSLAPYADLAAEHQPLLDIGCGRGEFLTICRTRGIDARGYDSNERSVAELKAKGLDVSMGLIPDCLGAVASGSVGSIFASHVVEHLPFSVLSALFAEAARVLRPGGVLMIETPNAGSLFMSASEFWKDPTHLAPRPSSSVALMTRELGFEVLRVETTHPFSEGHLLKTESTDAALQRLVDQLNALLFGDQDLRLILRRE